MPEPISVAALNLYVKSLLEGDEKLSYIAVKGEISNFKTHFASGHWYFTLKDSASAVKCVMFRGANSRVHFEVKDGTEVLVFGRVSLYEKDGSFQLYADDMKPSGSGDISLRFNLLKEKLEKEGLFDQSEKRKLPRFPKKIAVVTSIGGAAVKDILNILNRRYPLCEVLLCPVSVQGENAAREITDMLNKVYEQDGIDVIIIGRGGGSAEDLDAFNNEALARKVYESPVPIISAVGHETDFTICDFTADLRAPTPSAAAELAVPDIFEIKEKIKKTDIMLYKALRSSYEISNSRFLLCDKSFKDFAKKAFPDKMQRLDNACESLLNKISEKLTKSQSDLSLSIAKLDSLSPLKTLSRGFSIALKGEKKVTSLNDITQNDEIKVLFSDGEANCTVNSLIERNLK